MSRRESYSDTYTGKADENIRAILQCDDDSSIRLKKILLDIIKFELTPRQKEIITLYYFRDMDIVQIGKKLGITPQAVSAVMARARLRMLRILKFYK